MHWKQQSMKGEEGKPPAGCGSWGTALGRRNFPLKLLQEERRKGEEEGWSKLLPLQIFKQSNLKNIPLTLLVPASSK